MLKNLINVVVDRAVTRILIDVQPIAETVYDRLVDRYGHYNLLNELAERIDVQPIAEYVDTSEIVDRLDTYAIAAEVAEQVDWADHVPSAEEVTPLIIDRLDIAALAEQVAERIDHAALAERVAERTGSTAAAEVAPSAGLIDRMLDLAVDRLLARAEEAAARGDL